MAIKTVTLDPGESSEVAFNFIPDVAKVYAVNIDGLAGSFQAVAIPAIEPAIGVISAFWDKDTYEAGEFAALTVTIKNLASVAMTYNSIASCIQSVVGYVVRFEDTFSLAAGEERDIVFSGNVPAEYSTYIIYLDSYYSGECFHQTRMPDLIVSAPAVGAQLIMLGGTFIDTVWDLDQATYIKSGNLKNVGDEVGTTTVVGWFKVGSYGTIHDVYQETITLGPGQTRAISYTITRAEMEAAELEAGYHPESHYLESLLAYISTVDHAGYATVYGALSTFDVVWIETEYW